jgi:hypothetical protein
MKIPSESIVAAGGGYMPLEVELVYAGNAVVSAGALSGNHVAFATYRFSGDTDGDFDDNGFFYTVTGLTAGAAHVLSTNSQSLKVGIGTGTTRYLVLSQAEDSLKLAGTLTTGVELGGTHTTGVEFSGTFNKCINFANATLSAGSSNNLWSYGDASVGAVSVTITDYWFPVRMNVASIANPTAEKLAALMFLKFATTTAHQANLDIQGIGLTIDVGKNIGYAHGIDVVVDISVSSTTTTGSTYGGKFTLDFSSGTTMTYPSTGYHGAAVFAQVTGTGTYSGASVNIIHARKSGATTVQAGLDIEAQTGATITSGIHLRGAGNITNAIEFEDQDGSNGAKVVQATMDGDVADAIVRIDINGTAYYIPAFNAAGITGEF